MLIPHALMLSFHLECAVLVRITLLIHRLKERVKKRDKRSRVDIYAFIF